MRTKWAGLFSFMELLYLSCDDEIGIDNHASNTGKICRWEEGVEFEKAGRHSSEARSPPNKEETITWQYPPQRSINGATPFIPWLPSLSHVLLQKALRWWRVAPAIELQPNRPTISQSAVHQIASGGPRSSGEDSNPMWVDYLLLWNFVWACPAVCSC